MIGLLLRCAGVLGMSWIATLWPTYVIDATPLVFVAVAIRAAYVRLIFCHPVRIPMECPSWKASVVIG